MLRKLLKYDLRSMLRLFLPLWAAILLLSAVNHFTVFRLFNNFDGRLNISATVFLLAYVLLIGAVCVISLVYIIQRFYAGLLRDEGYLMFTLPVKHWQLVTAKLLTALLLLLFSAIVGCGAVALLGGDRLPWDKLPLLLSRIRWHFKDALLLVVLFLLLVFSLAKTILFFYLSMAIGQLSNKRKLLCSVAAYFVISLVLTSVSSLLFGDSSRLTDLLAHFTGQGDLVDKVLRIASVFLGLTVVQCAIAFFPTVELLRRRLNLE